MGLQDPVEAGAAGRPRIRYVPAVGPRLRKLLLVVFVLFALLAVDSVYLGTITWFEWWSGNTLQDYFYQVVFLLHLVLGFLIIAPVIVFGPLHFRNAWKRPNRRAVGAGIALFSTALVLLLSGIALTRLGLFDLKDPALRSGTYWAHVISPLALAVRSTVLLAVARAHRHRQFHSRQDADDGFLLPGMPQRHLREVGP